MVAAFFSLLGVPVYNADDRAKWILAHDVQVIDFLLKEFGAEAVKEGKPDTKFLAATVFSDKKELEKLNAVVHPRVKQDYEDWVEQKSNYPYTLKEAAILFEAESYKSLDKVIVVYAPVEVRMKRVLLRDTHRTETDILRIMDKQMPEEEKVKRADYIIKNDEAHLVIPQVLELHQLLLSL